MEDSFPGRFDGRPIGAQHRSEGSGARRRGWSLLVTDGGDRGQYQTCNLTARDPGEEGQVGAIHLSTLPLAARTLSQRNKGLSGGV